MPVDYVSQERFDWSEESEDEGHVSVPPEVREPSVAAHFKRAMRNRQNFGYDFVREYVQLPQTADVPAWERELRERLFETLPFLETDTVGERREFLVAPVLLELAAHLQVTPKREYQSSVITGMPELSGTFDYLLEGRANRLVIAASHADPADNFAHLYAQLIALDTWYQWHQPSKEIVYGAISLGNLWQFGLLHGEEKRIVQDLHLYRVPDDLPDLLRTLVGILTGTDETVPASS